MKEKIQESKTKKKQTIKRKWKKKILMVTFLATQQVS